MARAVRQYIEASAVVAFAVLVPLTSGCTEPPETMTIAEAAEAAEGTRVRVEGPIDAVARVSGYRNETFRSEEAAILKNGGVDVWGYLRNESEAAKLDKVRIGGLVVIEGTVGGLEGDKLVLEDSVVVEVATD